jgi:PAS domain S-box-containing protein
MGMKPDPRQPPMTPPPDAAAPPSTLRELRKLGTAPEAQFDALARLLATQFDCPMAWLGFLNDETGLWLKAEAGLNQRELPMAGSALLSALMDVDKVVVGDSLEDPRWARDIAAPRLNIRAFAAARIVVEGHVVGLACAMDLVPRTFDDSQLAALHDVALLAASLLEARLKEERWRLQEARVRTASLSSTDWLWESDASGRVTWVSSGVGTHTGRRPDEVVGHTLSELNRPSEGDTTDSWRRYRESRETFSPFREIIADRQTPNGLITVSLSGVPVFDSAGNFRGYRGSTSNITQRVQAQREARKAERLLSDSLDSLTVGVMITNASGQVVLANSIWRDSIGHFMGSGATWRQIVEQMTERGEYPDAQDRETFVRWRMGLASPHGEQHELRWKDRWVIISDRQLADGSVVHLSIDITDRKRAELELADQQTQLHDSQSRLRAVLEAVPDLWFVLDTEGRYLECSSATHPMLLHPWDTARGQLFAAGVPQPLADRVNAAIAFALASGEVQRLDYELVMPDGTARVFEARVSPMPNQRVLYVTRDLTEQSRAANKLRLSEELYRSVALAISDGLVVVTPTLKIIAVNPAGCAILGVTQAEAMSQGEIWPFQLLGADQSMLPPERNPVRRVVGSEQPLMNQIHALRRPDGELRWIALNAHPLQLHPEGGTLSVVLTFRDITQQRAAERALALAEERWKFALEGPGDGVWDWDVRSNKFFYSARWKEMCGYADDEIGDGADEWRSRVHADDLPHALAEMRRHLRGAIPLYDVEYRVRHRLGHELWVRDRGKAVSFDSEGRPLRVVGTQSDITRSKQAEQMLRDKQAAELASHAKSEFLSRMSHEMRTPLNAVIGFSQLLGLSHATPDSKTVREYAGHVLDAGEHLLALINDVLDLQKIEEGALSLSLSAVDLHDAIVRTVELLSPLAQAGQVHIDNQIAPGTWVQADMQRLRQVLLNVASNAIKYNHPGGSVRWRLEGAALGRLTLCIEDNGSGMSREQMSRLFEPFDRLGRETSTIEGTGLGLIIARSLAQAIGGRLSVASEAGRGTCVRLDLQCAEPPAQTALVPEAVDVVPAIAGLRMLYVEDNRINAILFEEAMRLHSSQIDLRVAEDGDQALTLAQDWQPEVLVLDAHLPGISGFEVLRLLRTLPGLDTVPAYMCSADAMPDDVQRAYEAGFIGYWTKPINVSAVLADIEQCVQRARTAPATDFG